jgi:hypothetical protein
MRIRTIVAGLAVATCAATHAVGAPADPGAGAAAFARLKTLVGQWEAQARDGHERLTYELVADGTALIERETAANRPEMLTVYHLDGNRLLLTHYCMAGNQPRMELRSFDASTGALTFDFVDATNLASPAAGHMHSVAMRLADADHIVTEWQFFENGKAKMTETARYARVR